MALTIQGPIANLLKVMNHKKQTEDIFAVRLILMIMDLGPAETNASIKDNIAYIFISQSHEITASSLTLIS
jgi:hypothetical protein